MPNKQWFTIPELRALNIEYFSKERLEQLSYRFPALKPFEARVRDVEAGTSPSLFEAEFHADQFPDDVRTQIAERCLVGVMGRVLKLGIHRPVANPRSRYVGPDVDAEIAALEAQIRAQKARRAA